MRHPTRIRLVNRSTKVTDDELGAMAEALDFQVLAFAAAWHIRRTEVTASAMLHADYTITLLDDADQANALGYHTETSHGQVEGFVFVNPVLDNGGKVLTGAPYTVSSVVSHELLETVADPDANRWCQDANGDLWALEVCDPVQASSYPFETSRGEVDVSDFVLPAWFDPHGDPAISHLQTGQPFTVTPGGYAVRWDSTGVHDVFGEAVPAWRKRSRRRVARRKAFRG